MPLRLTAVILTKNEAEHIADCIATLRDWTDAVVVWDSCSQDATRRIAEEAGACVVARPFDDYGRQRQAALDSINSEWILFIDADERATPALAQEVLRASQDTSCAGYWIPRRNFIVGHEMQGGGFTPDYQLRLLRRLAARYDLRREVHEVVILEGAEGRLNEPCCTTITPIGNSFTASSRFTPATKPESSRSRGFNRGRTTLSSSRHGSFAAASSHCKVGATASTDCASPCYSPGTTASSPIGCSCHASKPKTGASKVTGRLPRAAFQCSLRLKSVSMRVPHRVVFQLGVDAGRVGTCVSQRRLGDGKIVGGLVDASSEVVS